MLSLRVSRGVLKSPLYHVGCLLTRFSTHAAKQNTKHTHSNGLSSTCDNYNIIADRATSRVEHISPSLATTLLSQFIEHKYDSSKLRGFLGSGDDSTAEDMSINDYFVVLKVCNLIAIHDFDLVAPLSENLRLAFVDTYKRKRVAISEDDASKSDDSGGSTATTTKVEKSKRNYALRKPSKSDPPEAPSFMDAVRTTCMLYNELNILYDPLFKTIGNMLMECKIDISCDDAELILRTYATQNYRDHPLVAMIVSNIENGKYIIDSNNAMSFYRNLSHMDLISPELCLKLEEHFCTRLDEGDSGISFKFKDTLGMSEIIELGYTKFVHGSTEKNAFWFVKGVLEGVATRIDNAAPQELSISPQQRRKITLLTAFLKCLSEPCYNALGDANIATINNIISAETDYKKFKTTKFVEKVSEHLTKLRIRHETNIYANGVLLDIVEKPRNVVWLCNSYHRFYAASFDPTAESRALERLIRAFGFKTCPINYYQWGRLKAKRTRFAYIRMARYYAINDQRQYDHRYAGWSLPYVWWNTSRQDQMHISNYIKYEP